LTLAWVKTTTTLRISCSSDLGLTTLCKCTVDQYTVHNRLSQWIFQALKAWDEANVVFSHKVKLSFCHLVEKIEALIVEVF